jgi:hypothetical protein
MMHFQPKNNEKKVCRRTFSAGFVGGILLVMTLLFSVHAWGQTGGRSTYGFLNLTTSARSMALGTKTIAIDDNDLSLIYYNPALLSGHMQNHLAMSYVRYYGGVNYGSALYAPVIRKDYQLSAGIHYLNYGTFQQADERGIQGGEFSASEYSLNLSAALAIDSLWKVGVNLKPVFSQLHEYNSLGIATDLGVVYNDTSNLFTAAVVLRNLGTQIIPYHPGSYEPLPFEIQLGASIKLRHAPFRFIAVAEHLERPDLSYSKPQNNELLYTYYEGGYDDKSIFDKVMRHMIFGIEFTPLDHFYLRAGYSYRRRQEMKIESKLSTVGFSWGFGLKIYKLYLNYGRGTYHLAGGTNHFTIRANLNAF